MIEVELLDDDGDDIITTTWKCSRCKTVFDERERNVTVIGNAVKCPHCGKILFG